MAIEERTNKNGEVCSYRFRVCVGRDEQYKQKQSNARRA